MEGDVWYVWFGSHVPKYAEFSMSAFRAVNPNVRFNMVHRTAEQLECIVRGKADCREDSAIRAAAERILANDPTDGYVRRQIGLYGDGVRFAQVLADVARVEMVNEFGGIYLDCDTFPISPFPKWMFEADFVSCCRPRPGGYVKDNYFMARRPDAQRVVDPYGCPWETMFWHARWEATSTKFILNRRRFFECSLRPGEFSFSSDIVFDHYQGGSWRTSPTSFGRVSRCGCIPTMTLDEDQSWKR